LMFLFPVLLALLLILVPVVFALSSSLCKQGLGDFMFLLIKNQQVDGMRQPLSSFLGVLLAWTSLIGDWEYLMDLRWSFLMVFIGITYIVLLTKQ
jgi:hypothetical protein